MKPEISLLLKTVERILPSAEVSLSVEEDDSFDLWCAFPSGKALRSQAANINLLKRGLGDRFSGASPVTREGQSGLMVTVFKKSAVASSLQKVLSSIAHRLQATAKR